jgi:hypothetical protein
MAVISGVAGSVQIGSSALVECTGWTFNKKVSVHKYASCATGGFKAAVPGVKDGSGSISGKYDDADPIEDAIDVGDSVTLKLYVDADDFYSVPSVIESLDLTVDIDEGEIVGWEAGFQTNGAWTNPT